LEQLAGQEARRERKEALAHALEAGAPSSPLHKEASAILTVAKHKLNRATVARSPSTIFFAVSL
jgi:hypothetical protein